ncbi:MAG: Maf family protein [Anaerocolumna aminovalerica]|uniref:Maf family protein n=1 Tax=Anaerocolumna aminovalerica TaxID=1527 RepID=UPI001C0F0797|nr:Maf family protein [Anaerocolumna aminovalerica]MBU5332682.1 septum formation inhibitor Maf [Anaerocolumna aminovalerica]MDU6265876.1 Maf family protein [Anaerocolumna aminovalerica]
MYKIILASGSPRRKEIFEQIGIDFSVVISEDEEVIQKSRPDEIVEELATKKACSVASEMEEGTIVIGADTMVALDGQVMGKPKNEQDAKDMIGKLQGKKHQVYTGVCAVIKEIGKEERIIRFVQCTDVWVYPMTEEQIDAYVATGEPMDKAGAYGIQGKFAVHIEKVEGEYLNIVGFPISKLYQTLMKEGIDLLSFK